MINFIFTRKKLLVGVRAETSDILKFDGQPHIPFGERNMSQTLSDNLPAIQDAYKKFASSNGIALNGSLPASIVFPVEAESRDIHEVMHLLGAYSQIRFDLVHTDDLVQTFLHGIENNEGLLNEPSIVLEALDDYLSILYYYNTTKIRNQSFVSFAERIHSASSENIIELLEEEFARMGLILNDDEKKELEYQHTLSNNTFFIQKSNGIVHLTASVKKSDLPTTSPTLVDKPTLGKLLAPEKLDALGIKHIILLGDSLKQSSYLDFFQSELGIGDRIWTDKDKKSQPVFRTIVDGLYRRVDNPIANKLKLEKTNKDKGPQLKSNLDSQKLKTLETETRKKAIKEIENRSETQPEAETVKKESQKSKPEKSVESEKKKQQQNKNQRVKESEADKKEAVVEKVEPKAENEKVKAESDKTSNNQPKSDLKKEEKGKVETKAKDKSDNKSGKKKEKESPLQKIIEPDIKPAPTVKETKKSEPVEKGGKDSKDSGNTPVKISPDESVPKEIVTAEKVPVLEDKPSSTPKEKIHQPELETTVAEKTQPARVKTSSDLPAKQVLKAEWEKLNSMEAELKKQELDERRRFKELRAQIKKQHKLQDRKVNGNVNLALIDAKARLEQIFTLLKEFPREEFVTQLVMDNNLKTKKVLRFISNEDFSQSYLQDRFLYLYEKEAQYYKDLSNLFETEDGKFYFRDYLKGLTLGEHFKKTGLSKKTSLRKLNSKELEFIVDLIQTVESLPVSHCNINEKNILIQEKRTWNLQNETNINLIGFTSDDCSNEEMVNRMHEILHQMLAVGVYSDFRNTLKL